MIPTETSADTDKIIIPSSPGKLWLTGLGAIVFVAIGAWMLVAVPSSSNSVLNNPIVMRVVGALSILFFGAASYFIFKKMFDKRPALIIDRNGITHNAGSLISNFIPWQDIVGTAVYKVAGQQFIVLVLKNPDAYINQSTGIRRRLARSNYRMTGSPVNIGENGMQIKFDELKELIEQRYRQYANRS